MGNDLGNVLATVSDLRTLASGGIDTMGVVRYFAEVMTAQDYYPFGSTILGRVYDADISVYRYALISSFLFLVAFSFLGCHRRLDCNTYFLLIEDATGIKVGTHISFRGMSIGKVTSLSLGSNYVIVEVCLISNFKPIKGLTIRIARPTIFSRYEFVINQPSQSNEGFYLPNDTLNSQPLLPYQPSTEGSGT